MAQLAYFKLLVLFFILITSVSASRPGKSQLGVVRRSLVDESYAEIPPEYVELYYTQTLDHFNYKSESYQTFQQRYFLNYNYWGGANTSSPIFVYAGAETSITGQIPAIGLISDLASHFRGLLLYIEHRYYGKSVPFGSIDNQTTSTLGFFSSTQALADYSQLIIDVKKNLSADNCPVFVIGGSYGGMLAAWFRLKYPHVVYVALASSAPILYFDGVTPPDAYPVVVSRDFRNTSESCYNTIKQSWYEIDRVASEQNGLITLGDIFSFCSPLNSSQDLKDYLESIYMILAQYDNPPLHLVEDICKAIDGAPEGTYILGRVAAGLNASFFGHGPCHSAPVGRPTVQQFPWMWQRCTEMVIPIGVDNNNTMFQAYPFDLDKYTKQCQDFYNVTPRPHWATTEFGGPNIKFVLGNFASNIIFSNGLRDPYSAGGVLEDISESVVAIHTELGAHCLDLLPSRMTDPDWLVAQRQKEFSIIALWIAEYNAKLASKPGNIS